MASGNTSQTNGEADITARAPQRQRGRERVAALLAAAAAVFTEKGFDAATMTEIAARADAAIGTLYLFFPTKTVLAQALALDFARTLSAALDKLAATMAGKPAPEIADALFDTLFRFAAAHPAYAALIDLPGSDAWRTEIRAQRRDQIAGLFGEARPALPDGQCERLAMIVPQLMRIALTLGGTRPVRDQLREELRAMLHHHLAWPAGGKARKAATAKRPPSPSRPRRPRPRHNP